MAKNLGKYVDVTLVKTSDYYSKWNNIKDLLDSYVINTVEVGPAIIEKYVGDMYGLFKEQFSMKDELIYPHILVNGYLSSTDFNCEILRIKLLEERKLNDYLLKFNQKTVNL